MSFKCKIISLIPVLFFICGFMYIPQGHFGTLLIPDACIGTEIYVGNIYDARDLQYIVDRNNSCALLYIPGGTDNIILADHKNQGFEGIKSLEYGSFVYIFTENYIDIYSVTGKDYSGTNIMSPKYSSGTSVYNNIDGSLVLYTCNENPESITIVTCSKYGSFPR